MDYYSSIKGNELTEKHNMDESHRYYANWKNKVHENLEQAKLIYDEINEWLPGAGNGTEEMEIFYILTGVVFT